MAQSQRPLTPNNLKALSKTISSGYRPEVNHVGVEVGSTRKKTPINQGVGFILIAAAISLKTESEIIEDAPDKKVASFKFTRVEFDDLEALQEEYKKRFAIGDDEELEREFEDNVTQALMLLNQDLQDLVASSLNPKGFITTYLPEKRLEKKSSSVLLTHEPRRNVRIGAAERYSTALDLYFYPELISRMLNSAMWEILKMNEMSEDLYQVLPARSLRTDDRLVPTIEMIIKNPRLFRIFARDRFIQIDERVFRLGIREKDEKHLTHIERSIQQGIAADLQEAVSTQAEKIPFTTEGGNIIIHPEKKIMLICPSNRVLDRQGVFNGDYFGEKYYDSRSYEKYCANIEEWAASMGYEAIVVERNLENYTIQELYHLDVFAALIGDILLLPERQAVTPETYVRLERAFGAENIIKVSEEDYRNLASNLVVIDDTVIFSSPDISKSLISKIQERGYKCVVPPFLLTQTPSLPDNGVRCATQEIDPQLLVRKDMDASPSAVKAVPMVGIGNAAHPRLTKAK
jgi:N-dimethylarginine dimethylaminohydrolase